MRPMCQRLSMKIFFIKWDLQPYVSLATFAVFIYATSIYLS
jgi:hypothetical protein